MKNKTFIIYLLIISFSGCDRVKLEFNDVSKYEWLTPFLIDSIDFEGTHDIDKAVLKFSFCVNNTTPLDNIDSIARAQNWTLIDSSECNRTFIKKIRSYPLDNNIDTLEIEYSEVKNRLIFISN